MSRTCWACAQVSGEAEPAAPPFSNPMDAVSGLVPKGDAGRSGFSQACSGTSPMPGREPLHAEQQLGGRRRVTGLQVLLGALAGEHRPHVPGARVAPVGHGLPVGEQLVASGS